MYHWFTVSCQSLIYSKATQLYVITFFLCSFPLQCMTVYYWDIVQCITVPHLRTSLFIHSKPYSFHLPVPTSQHTPLPPPAHKHSLTSVSLCLFCCCCSLAELCLTLCDPMNGRTPGFPFLHYLPEFAQTHVHLVSDAIQPSYPLSPLSPLAPSLSWHQGLFLMSWFFASDDQSIGALAAVLLMNILGWFPLGLTGLISLLSKDSQESSLAP